MSFCVIKVCRNYIGRSRSTKKLSYHQIPIDPILRSQWIDIIRKSRSEDLWKPAKKSVLCSDHFNKNDMYFVNKQGRRRLKKGAVPCKASPMPWDKERVEIGSWARAGKYVTSILEDLNNFVVGWIDWNMCLDPEGGPNWADNFVDAPILVYGDQDEFIKQPMFYAMGHFSKFIPRGSRRISMSRRSLVTLENVAVLTPAGNIVIVLQNRRTREMRVKIRTSSRRYIEINMEPQSIKTIEVNPN